MEWCCTVLMALACLRQDDGLERTLHPDGSVKEEWQVNPSGERSGSYKSWHANGKEAVRGRYSKGLRTGRWRAWYESGKRASSGKYAEDYRSGEWQYWTPEGDLDATESGDYSVERSEYSDGAMRAMGEMKDGVLHGRWTLTWEHGPRKAEGKYRDGRWHGPWRFWLVDGSFDENWISGVYDEGARAADLDLAEAPADQELVPLPPPGRASSFSPFAERNLVRVFAEYLEDGEKRAMALQQLSGTGRPLLAVVVREMLQLDLTQPSDLERARTWERELLSPMCAGLAMGFVDTTEPQADEANRRALLYWATFAHLTADAPGYLEIDLRGLARAKPNVERSPGGVVPPVTHGAEWPAGAGSEFTFPYSLRFEHSTHRPPPKPKRGQEDMSLSEEHREAIDAGLRWLALHQSFDGAWRGMDFLENCDAAEGAGCTGAGSENASAGITGLALLAFLANGNTPDLGPYRDTVARGVGWLAAQQHEQGFLAPMDRNNWIYQHSIATLALCEALRFHEDDYLRLTCERAVATLHKARNPYGAWRYDFPPQGNQDTSITAWVTQALKAAELVAIAVDPDTYEGALNWIDEATDAESYRTGYDFAGSASARTTENRAYTTQVEGLTAAALFVRSFVGASSEREQLLEQQTRIVLDQLPHWDEDGTANDMYGWYYGSQAMSQVGGTAWRKWSVAMQQTAMHSQRVDSGFVGSWDTDTAWGYYGGRVYTTAMMLLCLEAGYRLERF